MATLNIGDTAPQFELLDQQRSPFALKDQLGTPLFLFFFPKPSTPGCTTQSCEVRDALPELGKLAIRSAAISVCEPAAQAKFDAKHNFGFPLLSDPNHAVCEAYGVWGERSLYGHKYMGITRSSFLIDAQGKLQQVWYKISPKKTVPELLKALR